MGTEPLPHDEVPRQLRRERLLDMELRLARHRRSAFLVLAAGLVATGPWVGWWWLVPLAAAGLAFGVADRFLKRSARPERWAAAAWAVSPLMIAVSVALTGAADSPATSWFALPAVTLMTRFERRGVFAGMAYLVALILGSTVAIDPGAVLEYPPLAISPMVLTIACVLLAGAVVQSDREHRREAVIDPLTGLLNRTALAQRFAELGHRDALDATPVSLLLGDLDHFKRINDEHGHAVGDAVLRDAAYAMRSALRALDLVYRVGGEEFLVVLPGASAEEAMEVGERLREAVAGCSRPGIPVTMSFGVATGIGPSGDPAALFASADVALYSAKRDGRDRVRAATGAAVKLPA